MSTFVPIPTEGSVSFYVQQADGLLRTGVATLEVPASLAGVLVCRRRPGRLYIEPRNP